MLGIHSTAACATVELARDLFYVFKWAVNGDYVRGFAIVSEGQVVWVREVGDA